MEGSATWVEDVVYDNINDNYQYLDNSAITHPRTALDYTGGAYPYGSFIFFSYATAKRGATVVRRFWDAAVGATHLAPGDPSAVVGDASWPAFFATFDSWNTLPLHSYPERAGYPSARVVAAQDTDRRTRPRPAGTASRSRTSAARPSCVSPASNLAGPQAAAGQHRRPARRRPGSRRLLQRRYRDGQVTHTMIRLGRQRQRQHAGAVQPQGAQLGRHRASRTRTVTARPGSSRCGPASAR